MRIRRLSIAGFGPYKTEQRIDFDAFRDDGLFLITGKTGAGKSSILDAICYALYGSIPRFDGAQPKLRSDHCAPDDPTFVELEFTIHDVDYIVRRVPDYERLKKNGTGTTTNKGTAELSRLVAGEWQPFAVGPRVVAGELEGILNLTKDQFLQVILLAQNRFQEFLLAKNDERQAVLRSLFGTRRFEQMETALVERHKLVREQLESGRQRIAQHAAQAAALITGEDGGVPAAPGLAWFEAALATVDGELAEADAAARLSDEAFTERDAAHRAAAETEKRQRRRRDAVARLEALAAEAPSIAADRHALAAARRAAAVVPYLTARQEAAAALDSAVRDESAARTELATFRDDAAELTLGALTSDIDELTRALGTLDAVMAEERELPALEATIRTLTDEVAVADAAVGEATARLEALPLDIDRALERLADAQVRASAEAEADARLQRAVAARAAVTRAAALENEHADAMRSEAQASGASAAAAALLHRLIEQRLNGHAAELARTLVDGDPCAVCGSPEHPAPAVGSTEPVSQRDIDAARAEAERAAAAAAAAGSAERELATRLAEARTEAGGRSGEQLGDEVAEATVALEDARAAAASISSVQGTVATLRAELAEAQSRLAALRADREDAAQRLVVHEERRSSIAHRVNAQRGDHESVEEHVHALQAHRAAAVGVTEALARTAGKRDALGRAGEQLAAQLVGHGFTDEHEARDAERPVADMIGWEERIRSHEHALAIAEATLADPELEALPSEVVDVTAAREQADAARSARDAMLAARSSVAERRTQLARILTAVRQHDAASGELQRQHAQLSELASAVQGKDPNTKRMRLETYVLAAQLEEIVDAANSRLRIMTSGRYTLQHDDSVQYRNTQSGLGLAILDEHTGRARATQSLSGGETFLASLALALGLAEVVTNQAGGITLDTLFIDEGFGSLDGETLEIAMGTLDGLRAGGRTIGLISHVDAMKEQIPAKLRIAVTPHGFSEIEPSFAFA